MQIYLYVQPLALENHIESITFGTQLEMCAIHRILFILRIKKEIVDARKFHVDDIAVRSRINLSPWHIMIPWNAIHAINV